MQNWTKEEKKIQSFLGYCILNYKGTKFEFHPTSKLKDGACEYTGEALKDRLTIATGGDRDTWLQVFLHETCHLDQAQEHPTWFDSIDQYISALDNWLEHKETPCPINWENVSKIVELEHDCEKRAIEKIKLFGLPISTEEYAQKANAYLKSYIHTLKNREWESTPYTNPKKWTAMPKKLMPMEELHRVAVGELCCEQKGETKPPKPKERKPIDLEVC